MVDEQNANRIAELKNRMSRMNAPPVLVNGVSVEDPANKTLVGKLKAVGGKLKKEFKEHAMPYVALGAVVGSLAVGWLTYDHLSKRQHVAERNVTYRTSHTLYIAGNKEKKAAEKADRESITQVQEGGGVESKVGSYLAEIHREVRGDIEYYKMFNTQQKRIASTDQKPERFQAGWRLRGSINFKEQFAKLDSDKENSKIKGASKYMVYKYDPERGRKQFDVDVVEYPVDGGLGKNELGIVETKANGEQDKRVMVNRLVEKRNLLGFFFGDFYRTGTILEDFVASPENQALATQFFKAVRGIDGTESINPKVREKLADEMVAITERMEKQPIYSTFEDGYLKLLPQESTMYVGENPGTLQRFTQWLGINRGKSNILRVENHWDLFPGSWMGLKTVKLGEGKNRNYLFDKYNNGGYTLKDKFGDIARIDIQDFFLSYGNDVVYHYYLDLNGNGKIDRPNKLLNAVRTLLGKPKITYDELIGSVLCKPTHDEIVELENIAKGINPESDLTFSSNYSYICLLYTSPSPRD